MRHFNGLGTGTSKDALEEAIKGLVNPTCIVYFSDYEEIPTIDKILEEKYPGVDRLGIAGSLYYHGKVCDFANLIGAKNNNSIAVMAFYDDAEVRTGVIEKITKTPILALRKIDKQFSEMNVSRDNTICITLNTINEETVVSTLKPVLEKYNIKMMGGSVGGFFGKDVKPFIMYNGEKYEECTGYILIKNKVGRINIYRQDIYEPISDDLLTITKVENVTSRKLMEVNGVKISKLYSEKYGISVDEMKKNLVHYTLNTPIGAIIGSEHYIISMSDVNSDGSTYTFKKITEGESIAYMRAADHDKKEKDLIEKIKKDMPNRSLIFSVDCLYRTLCYTGNKYLDTYIQGMNSIADHVGMIGVGEQNEIQHFNQTMICAVFE